ncbi:MAG: hypothetical protein GXP27_05365 [Planctomycetes bacterium]|nr:hypothetical protein [Planctomycetota bacterium]
MAVSKQDCHRTMFVADGLFRPFSSSSTTRARVLAVILLLLVPSVGFIAVGCSEQPPPLEPKVTTPVGRPGVCSQCNKKIENVTEENLFTIDGVQYVLCSEQCAKELEKWLAEQ